MLHKIVCIFSVFFFILFVENHSDISKLQFVHTANECIFTEKNSLRSVAMDKISGI